MSHWRAPILAPSPTSEDAKSDDMMERGVHNPRVIDLITYLAKADTVELLMIETRSWDLSTPLQGLQIEEKLNSYLGYILDGYLAKDYPQYAGKQVTIALDCPELPRGPIADLTQAMSKYLNDIAIGFELRCRETGLVETETPKEV